MLAIDLSDKTAIVTGAGRGLGAATARALHRAGAAVVINFFDDPDGHNRGEAERLAAELGDRAAALSADVREPDQLDTLAEAVVDRFGGIDILVNNAGILRDRTMKKMAHGDWQAVIDTNLTGVFNACKAVAPSLRPGGRIVNLASISAAVGFFGQANYASAKAGVIGLTKVLSKELARDGVTVNAVAPGVVLTEMGQSIPEAAREKMLESIPLDRFGEPEDIAHAIAFLCSDLAGYITGQTIHVNGGWWG